MSKGGGDHTDYVAFLRRVLRALSRRVGDADPVDLAEMVALRGEVDSAIAQAVAGMRARGVPWSDIGRATGRSRATMTGTCRRGGWGRLRRGCCLRAGRCTRFGTDSRRERMPLIVTC